MLACLELHMEYSVLLVWIVLGKGEFSCARSYIDWKGLLNVDKPRDWVSTALWFRLNPKTEAPRAYSNRRRSRLEGNFNRLSYGISANPQEIWVSLSLSSRGPNHLCNTKTIIVVALVVLRGSTSEVTVTHWIPLGDLVFCLTLLGFISLDSKHLQNV